MSPLAEAIRRITPCERCEWRAFEPARRLVVEGGRPMPVCAAHVQDGARGPCTNTLPDLEDWDDATPEEREAALVEAFG